MLTKRKILFICLIIILLLLALGFFKKVTGNGAITQKTVTKEPIDKDDIDDDTTIPAGYKTITIANGAFSPATITIKPTTQVTWVNKDMRSYLIIVPQMGWQVGPIKARSSNDVRFDIVGTYAYYDKLHPSIKGVVVVTK